jgi:hypothetical protein
LEMPDRHHDAGGTTQPIYICALIKLALAHLSLIVHWHPIGSWCVFFKVQIKACCLLKISFTCNFGNAAISGM